MRRLLERLPLPGSDKARYVLGLTVTEGALHGILLERTRDGARVVRRLTRQRSGLGGEDFGAGSLEEAAVPGAQEESTGGDFTLQFGDGADGGAGDFFLQSEFGELDDLPAEGGAPADAPDFVLGLKDLLSECRDAGYEDPLVAFCLAAADTKPLELRVPEARTDASAKGVAPSVKEVGRKKLMKLLDAQYDGAVDPERTVLLPMTPTDEGAPRFLAIVGRPTDPVMTTLRAVRAGGGRLPAARLIAPELAVHLALARAERPKSLGESAAESLVVRAGEEDTLVFFMKGGTLRHSEILRSLTAFDAPETICSRVMLLQDEYGIGDVSHVRLTGAAQEEELIEGFEMFFPEAEVEPLRAPAPLASDDLFGDADGATLAALGAALHLTGEADTHPGATDVNLLPKKFARRQLRMPVSPYVLGLYAVLFAVTLFFVGRYFTMENKIGEARQELRQLPVEAIDTRPQVLQARIDSLKNLRQSYVDGLRVLDQLLKGSDRWSQAMDELSAEVAAVRGLWVESWAPQGNEVRLSGTATSRSRIVRLADRLNAVIRSQKFSEIRDWPVYSFTMVMPLKTGLPAATKYLRSQATAQADTEGTAAKTPTAPAALKGETGQ